MNRFVSRYIAAALSGLTLIASLAGCESASLHRNGLRLVRQGQYEVGLQTLEAAAQSAPENSVYRKDWLVSREKALNALFAAAAAQSADGKLEEAEATYRQILQLDRTNLRASGALEEILQAKRVNKGEKAPTGESDTSSLLAHRSPTATYRKPVTLEFRDTPVKMAFDMLSKTTGINFILDRDIRPDLRASIDVRQMPLDEVVDFLLTTNKLDKKVLGLNSVLIYPRTLDKKQEYEDLIVKSFHLANADPKQVEGTLKTLLKPRDLVVDDTLNMIIMRDSPQTVELAEKMIQLQDLAEPEVMLEVEVLEIQHNRLMELGVQYPNQATLTLLSASNASSLILDDLKRLNGHNVGVGIGDTLVNLRKEDGDSNLLANPRIRVRNREKAKILIGEKVPVITTTATSTGFVSDSVQYVDVGLKFEVEPTVYLHDDVGIKLSLEVSSITQQIKTAAGGLAYQIGTRNASTALRLHDGEPQVLAGLINDEDRKSANKIPGLGDLPLLGRLFGSHLRNHQKTEIVLSITPHLIRNIVPPTVAASAFWSGTESVAKFSPLMAKTSPKFDQAPDSPPTPPGEPAKSPNVTLSWEGPTQVALGESFDVTLKARSDVELRGLPMRIDFDPTALEVEDVVEGGFFSQNGGKTAFSRQIDNTNGTVLIALSRVSGDSIKGDGPVLSLKLKGKRNQDSTLTVASALPVGAELNSLNARSTAHTITVSN